jgi:hypothetical protein
MQLEEIEAEVRALKNQFRIAQDKVEELETRLKTRESELRTLQDVKDIERVQYCYGYYIEHFMGKEIIDLFADGPDTVMYFLGMGTYLGKEGVRRCFATDPEKMNPPGWHAEQGTKEFFHSLPMCSGIIDVAPDGQTAQGRWYGLLTLNMTGKEGNELQAILIYENDFVKENGKWKIKVFRFGSLLDWGAGKENLKAKLAEEANSDKPAKTALHKCTTDGPPTFKFWDVQGVKYPSGYIVPFHFKHPVTGEKTSDEAWNDALPGYEYKEPKTR